VSLHITAGQVKIARALISRACNFPLRGHLESRTMQIEIRQTIFSYRLSQACQRTKREAMDKTEMPLACAKLQRVNIVAPHNRHASAFEK
jgi:hypothetical protein